MGENYYLKYNACPCCGHFRNELHIGKASAGWRFLFQAYDEIDSVEQWEEKIKEGTIYNEYNEVIDNKWFWNMIAEHQKEEPRDHKAEYTFPVGEYEFSRSDFS